MDNDCFKEEKERIKTIIFAKNRVERHFGFQQNAKRTRKLKTGATIGLLYGGGAFTL